MASKKQAEETTVEPQEDPTVTEELKARLEKIESKVDPQYTDSQAFVNRGMHPNQIA